MAEPGRSAQHSSSPWPKIADCQEGQQPTISDEALCCGFMLAKTNSRTVNDFGKLGVQA